MPIGLTSDQRLLQESASRFVREAYSFERRQQLVASETGHDPEHWRSFAELGWLAAPFAEEHGGLALSAFELAVLTEQLGRGLYVGPYWSSVIFAGGLVERLAEAGRSAELLAPVIDGSGHLSLAWMERSSRYSLERVETTAVRDGQGFVLTGEKILVPWAHLADVVLVTARLADAPGGLSVFAVPRQSEGIREHRFAANDGNRASNLSFESVRLEAEALIGPPGAATDAVLDAADAATLALAAEATGCVSALHDQTLAFIKQREQFGRPIGKFQVVQHAMVDINIQHQTLQSMTFAAAQHMDLDIPRDEKQRMVSTAKAHAEWYGRPAAEAAFQLHGAIAMSAELPIGHYLKRLTAINTLLGDADHHMRRFQALAAGGAAA